MNDPNEVPKVAPSASTVATGLSGAVTIVVLWAIGKSGVVIPPEIAAAITLIVGTVIGYIPRSGRS